ncbi:ABC transporter substrate-binding protein [Rhodococcus sp. ARC_M6]|uniref:ABC transporter substrate-binding protein n=1 Tax=Rhodococcus sp. ARC_M6 TaxID=2928852 RepID=UPI001FB56B51|nr:ABC transporter substrate-binding protein [Rhodococcus sp. ARC_M6]MCJ0903872.1 ABC transporter substrate-binding protein [Rhodococcus sp. ARC_M6]
MKSNKTAKLVVALAAVAALVSACSGDRGEDPSATSTGGSGTTANAASSSSDAKFGTLNSPCGAGDAKGATDQGVSDTEIKIGFGDDRGYVKSPGLNKEMSDAVGALISWCNDQGGINGRKVVGTDYDAAMTQANSVMQEACASQFMMVGHGFAMDQTAEQTRVACNMVAVPGFTVSPDATNGPMTFQGVPMPVDYSNAAAWFQMAEMHPDLLGDFDVVNSTMPSIIASTTKTRSMAAAAGFKLKDCGVTLNYEGESSYVPFAEKFKECGVKGIWTSRSASPPELNFVKALDQVGIDPIFFGEATWYGESVSAWNKDTGLLDNLNADMVFQMLENSDKVPAVKKYSDLVSASGGKTALLGMQAASSFLLWATAANECGSDLTRQCMVNELSSIHDWDGGGLHAVTDPGKNMPTTCGLMTELTGDTYSQVFPTATGEFKCDPKYLVANDKSIWGTELGADRISTKYQNANVIKPQS